MKTINLEPDEDQQDVEQYDYDEEINNKQNIMKLVGVVLLVYGIYLLITVIQNDHD